MSVFRIFGVSLTGLCVAFGCMAQHRPIPTGTYISDSKPGEEVSVSPSDIRFRVKVKDRLVDRKYDYTVYPKDGEIQPKGLTSNDFMVGIGFYDWYWDGKAILRKDANTGESVAYHKK
jgi:hypothetical protein